MVPHVDTRGSGAAGGRQPAATRLPGCGPRAGRAATGSGAGSTDMAEALARANANVTLSVQIESVAGLAALPAMLALGGIDYFTVGKQDLAQSMGFARLASGWPPQVTDAAKDAAALVHAAGCKMKDDVMTLCRVNQLLVGGREGLSGRTGRGMSKEADSRPSRRRRVTLHAGRCRRGPATAMAISSPSRDLYPAGNETMALAPGRILPGCPCPAGLFARRAGAGRRLQVRQPRHAGCAGPASRHACAAWRWWPPTRPRPIWPR